MVIYPWDTIKIEIEIEIKMGISAFRESAVA